MEKEQEALENALIKVANLNKNLTDIENSI